MTTPSGLARRSVGFALLVGLTVATFGVSLATLVRFSFQAEHYSHIVLIPLLSAVLVGLERRYVFARVETHRTAGVALLGAGALIAVVGQRLSESTSLNDRLSVVVVGVVTSIVGAFALCYGVRALRASLFPILLLYLMVPIPDILLSRVILWLQIGSAAVTHALFELVGTPVLRTGLVFALPGVTIEVAQECSGIRSSLALLITSLLAGHFVLRSPWAKAALVLATIPLLVVKNGIRIVTLSLLSIHVDSSYLSGNLHQRGGIVFFALSLALLMPILVLLQKSERSHQRRVDLHA
jgi:exosortase